MLFEKTDIRTANKDTSYICESCEDIMFVVEGPLVKKHFRHLIDNGCEYYKNTVLKNESRESINHILGKKYIIELVSSHPVKVEQKCKECNTSSSGILRVSTSQKVVEEHPIERTPYIADVACLNTGGSIDWIVEIMATHPTSEMRRIGYDYYDLKALEVIDLYNRWKHDPEIELYITSHREFCQQCLLERRGKIYLSQRGAGCGKTYDSIELMKKKEFSRKTCFIYISKMHSAKDVIFAEFKNQYGSQIEEYEKEGRTGKQYVRLYKNNVDIIITVIIGTIDSFLYALSRGAKKMCYEMQDQWLSTIKEYSDDEVFNVGRSFYYGGVRFSLDSGTIVTIDESQDIINIGNFNAVDAIASFSYRCGFDIKMIGDVLQSIFGQNNFSQIYKSSSPKYQIQGTNTLISVIKDEPVNWVRRFKDPLFGTFLNKLIPFEKHGLLKVDRVGINGNLVDNFTEINTDVIVPFDFDTSYDTEEEGRPYERIKESTIETIKYYITVEAIEKERMPSDFLFIIPRCKSEIAKQLEQETADIFQELFLDKRYHKILDRDGYWSATKGGVKRYINFHGELPKIVERHASENGMSINLNESEDLARITSIYAAKGTGRKVVFLINISKKEIEIFTDRCIDIDDLTKDSMINVSFSRHMEKLYFGIQDEQDEIALNVMSILGRGTGASPGLKNMKKRSNFGDLMLRSKIMDSTFGQSFKNSLEEYGNRTIELGKHQIVDQKFLTSRYLMTTIDYRMTLLFLLSSEFQKTGYSIFSQAFFQEMNNLIKKVPIVLTNTHDYKRYSDDIKNSRRKGSKSVFGYPILDISIRHQELNVMIKKTFSHAIEKIKGLTDLLEEAKRDLTAHQREMWKDSLREELRNHFPKFCPFEQILIRFYTSFFTGYPVITLIDFYKITDEFDRFYSKEDCPIFGDGGLCCCDLFSGRNKKTMKDEITYFYRGYFKSNYTSLKQVGVILDRLEEITAGSSRYMKINTDVHDVLVKSDDFDIYENFGLIGYCKKYVYIFNINPQFDANMVNKSMMKLTQEAFFLRNSNKSETKDPKILKYKGKKVIGIFLSPDIKVDDPIIHETFGGNIPPHMGGSNEYSQYLRSSIEYKYENYTSGIIQSLRDNKINLFLPENAIKVLKEVVANLSKNMKGTYIYSYFSHISEALELAINNKNKRKIDYFMENIVHIDEIENELKLKLCQKLNEIFLP